MSLAVLAAGFFVFARLGGLLMTLPGLGTDAVPAWARLGAALPLTVVMVPAVPAPELPATVGGLVAGVLTEAFVGAATGVAVAMIVGALATAADIIGTKIGMNLGFMLDPLTNTSQSPLAGLAGWLAVAVFFATDTHLRCVLVLARSLSELPPGSVAHPLRAGAVLVDVVSIVTLTAVQLAGPVAVFVFLVNLALLVLGRMAPNLQIFFGIGPSLTLGAGLALLAVALPTLLAVFARLATTSPQWMQRLLDGIAGG